MRDLLIALNGARNISRDAICRLAIKPEAWLEPRRDPQVACRDIGVRAADVEKARALATESRALARIEIDRAHRLGAEIATRASVSYPSSLLQLELPPPALYVRGQIPRAPAIAIVGSRQASRAGLEAAELFGHELAACGLTVVSGFARGIDLASHNGALTAGGGRTVAVLGCGLDVEYPRGRRRLRDRIARRGALISEFPFGTPPLAKNFPIRNRIIAGLSVGTLVVQAAPRSGSLITARLALDLGRDVYAVPGPIFDQRSTGPNGLIRDGALLVQHPRDIIESLPTRLRDGLVRSSTRSEEARTGPEEGELLRHLPPGELVTADRLAVRAGRPLSQVLSCLLELELTGLVRRYPGSVFCRRP